MITLDYTTYNPRWKHSGIRYSSWEAFAFALGYLANRLHYRNINDSGLIELHFESNDNQGAWGKEGIIGYSGAGKSTLVRCVNLLEVPDSGEINVNGVQLTRMESTPKGEVLRKVSDKELNRARKGKERM